MESAHSDGQSTAWNCSARHKWKSSRQGGSTCLYSALWVEGICGLFVHLPYAANEFGILIGLLDTHKLVGLWSCVY